MKDEPTNNNNDLAPNGDAPFLPGVSSKTNTNTEQDDQAVPPPDMGVSGATPGDVRASVEVPLKYDNSHLSYEEWAATGDALQTVKEARLYLFEVYDYLLKERYTQKLVTTRQLLDGKRSGKAAGGSEILIKLPSVDAYAERLNNEAFEKYGDRSLHPFHASNTDLDPEDPIFFDLKEIAEKKPYSVPIQGAVLPRPAAPAEPLETANTGNNEPSLQDNLNNGASQPSAHTGTGNSPNALNTAMVSRELYTDAKQRGDEYKDLLTKEQQGREADRIAFNRLTSEVIEDAKAAFNRLADISEVMANAAGSAPSEVLNGIAGVISGKQPTPKPEVLPNDDDAAPIKVETQPYSRPAFQRHSAFKNPNSNGGAQSSV